MLTLRNGPYCRGQGHFEVALGRLMEHRHPGWQPAPGEGDIELRTTRVVRESVRARAEDLPDILKAADDVGPRMRRLMGWKP